MVLSLSVLSLSSDTAERQRQLNLQDEKVQASF